MMAASQSHTASEDLELLRSNAVAAGIIAAGFFRRQIRTWTKENASPVTEADEAVDRFLESSLRAARPEYGWLSEETADDRTRLQASRVFIIDPIDGTRAFIRGEDCWTISLAIVENGETTAGVIYAPARDELYEALSGCGARLNGKPLPKRGGRTQKPVIPAPAAVHKELQVGGLDYVRGPAYPSLAYRLAKVASGTLDAAVARRGAQDWDIAAATLILQECGVGFEDVCTGPPRFNRETTRHSALAAVADESLRGLLHNALRHVYGCPDDLDGEKRLQEQKSS